MSHFVDCYTIEIIKELHIAFILHAFITPENNGLEN
jgi:hypothetical protein